MVTGVWSGPTRLLLSCAVRARGCGEETEGGSAAMAAQRSSAGWGNAAIAT
jgi:hypothetical protein